MLVGCSTKWCAGQSEPAGRERRGCVRSGLQPESPGPYGGLELHPHVGGECRRDRIDVDRVRPGGRASVPWGGAQTRWGIVSVAPPPSGEDAPAHPDTWTVRVREATVKTLPPEKLLPDGQPTYVASWIYVFGVTSIASLIVIIASGSILALKGPAWWHYTGVGHFFNSIHMWSVELFFFVMVVH